MEEAAAVMLVNPAIAHGRAVGQQLVTRSIPAGCTVGLRSPVFEQRRRHYGRCMTPQTMVYLSEAGTRREKL